MQPNCYLNPSAKRKNSMIKNYLRKFFASTFYPTNSEDWYKSKGYNGQDEQEQFSQFLSSQDQEGAVFYNEFKSLNLKRQFIQSGEYKLDSVLLVPQHLSHISHPEFTSGSQAAEEGFRIESGMTLVEKQMVPKKSSEDIYFVFFQGRGEFYESRFRDMAIQAQETGAFVLGFNPKGFKSSTGKTETIFDIVDDGIAVVKYLLDQMHLRPWQIVLQGNSLGGGVQEMVAEHFRKLYGFRFRQINSNSFKTLAAVLAHHYQVPFLERIIRLVLLYAQWEIIPGKDFYKTGPYRCHLRRQNDRTIAIDAEYNIKIDIESDCAESPAGYKETNRWLYENCQLVYNGNSETDPHFLSLHYFDLPGEEGKSRHSVYSFINRYLEKSAKYTEY